MADRAAALIAQLAALLAAQTLVTTHTYDCPALLAHRARGGASASPACSTSCRQVQAALAAARGYLADPSA